MDIEKQNYITYKVWEIEKALNKEEIKFLISMLELWIKKDEEEVEYRVEEDMELDKEKSYNSIVGNI